jgi:hypothetical protein
MATSRRPTTLGVVPLTWTLVGSGDFDADGDPDILGATAAARS